jgi:antitoxin ParD1/3/4
MTMNINLSPQLEELIRNKVSSGFYSSASEVVREALRMMEERDRMKAIKFEQLRQDIHEGMESGPATEWNAEETKQEGRKMRASKTRIGHE